MVERCSARATVHRRRVGGAPKYLHLRPFMASEARRPDRLRAGSPPNAWATRLSESGLCFEQCSRRDDCTHKIVAAWTGANERTVKNWFSGHYGPSGVHLVTLIKHCDEVLSVVLSMADRSQLLAGSKLEEIEERLIDLAAHLRAQRGKRRSGRPRTGKS
jgi:hypothetical protein